MDSALRDPLVDLLRPQRLTAIVDIGSSPIDGSPPYKHMLASGLCTVIGFEPQPEALAELDRRKGPHERYLPYVVGDGRERSLHICRQPGMTSLLSPDPERLRLFNEMPTFGTVSGKIPVATRRLDDISEVERIDYLKIDIQGGELDVFKSGRRKLARAVAIETEASFVTLYRKQPAFGLVDTFLRELGFIPHCIASVTRWPIAPTVIDGDPLKGVNQIIEADIVYVRDFTRIDNMDAEQWKHLAMIAHHCYSSIDLAVRASRPPRSSTGSLPMPRSAT
jgi:FkbM family methyltransferase